MTITVDNLRRRVPAGELLASGMGRGLIRVRVSISNVRCAHPQQPGGVEGRRLWLFGPNWGHMARRESRRSRRRERGHGGLEGPTGP